MVSVRRSPAAVRRQRSAALLLRGVFGRGWDFGYCLSGQDSPRTCLYLRCGRRGGFLFGCVGGTTGWSINGALSPGSKYCLVCGPKLKHHCLSLDHIFRFEHCGRSANRGFENNDDCQSKRYRRMPQTGGPLYKWTSFVRVIIDVSLTVASSIHMPTRSPAHTTRPFRYKRLEMSAANCRCTALGESLIPNIYEATP